MALQELPSRSRNFVYLSVTCHGRRNSTASNLLHCGGATFLVRQRPTQRQWRPAAAPAQPQLYRGWRRGDRVGHPAMATGGDDRATSGRAVANNIGAIPIGAARLGEQRDLARHRSQTICRADAGDPRRVTRHQRSHHGKRGSADRARHGVAHSECEKPRSSVRD